MFLLSSLGFQLFQFFIRVPNLFLVMIHACLVDYLNFFQCAVLYTTVFGQRRIRVTTLSLPCTSMLTNLFRSADLDTQFTCFLKQGICFYFYTSLLLYFFTSTFICISQFIIVIFIKNSSLKL